jgi:hypothetical protein
MPSTDPVGPIRCAIDGRIAAANIDGPGQPQGWERSFAVMGKTADQDVFEAYKFRHQDFVPEIDELAAFGCG